MAIMHLFSKRSHKKNPDDQHLALENIRYDNKTKIEFVRAPPNHPKRKWSEAISQLGDEDNYFQNQFR